MDPNCQLVVVREAGEAWTCLDYKYAILYIYNKLCKNTQVYSHPLWSLFLFLLVQPALGPCNLAVPELRDHGCTPQRCGGSMLPMAEERHERGVKGSSQTKLRTSYPVSGSPGQTSQSASLKFFWGEMVSVQNKNSWNRLTCFSS